VTPAPEVNFVFLNTHKRPFDNVHARRALAFALDRGRMTETAGGSESAQATCQILPPGLPGYRPYCPFTAGGDTAGWAAPNLARAQAELRRSGTSGARVRVITTEGDPSFKAQNLEVAATLRRLGYRVTVTHYRDDHAYFNEMNNHADRVGAAVNGWIQDYPAASNFLGVVNCPRSPYNCSGEYRSRLGRAAADASASGSTAPWTKLDRYVTDNAIVVPYLNQKSSDFSSERVGNYQHHPEFDLLIDQVWVK
jgi:peptide/nickel transport system substrate-binding protein